MRKKHADISVGTVVAIIAVLALVAGLLILAGRLVSSDKKPETPPEEEMPATVVFSELMASNKSAYADEDGNFYDWLELHNVSGEQLDVSGCYLCTSDTSLDWQIPAGTVLDKDGYVVILCTGKTESGLRAPLKLSKNGGETLLLRDPTSSVVLDRVTTLALGSDQVMTRPEEGQDAWQISDVCTPGFANTKEGRACFEETLVGTSDTLLVSELMAKNHMTLRDAYGAYSDFVELVNISDSTLDLSDYYLTNDKNDPYSDRLKGTLEPGQRVVIFASGRGLVAENGEQHLSFKLSDNGATVYLYTKQGVCIQSVSYTSLGADESYALGKDGLFFKTLFPTPSFDNTDDGFEAWVETLGTPDDLYINEVLVCNTKYLRQSGGHYYDIIELYNPTDHAVNLSDYCLSDDDDARTAFRLPDVTVKAGAYYVVFASGDTSLTPTKTYEYVHAPFKLSEGEELYLSRADGTPVDAVRLNDLAADQSKGRLSGQNGWFYFTVPTPKKVNENGVRRVTAEPETSVREGVYDNVSEVVVSLLCEDGATVYYTLDGNVPDKNAQVYTSPFVLSSTTVIRAVACKDGQLDSGVKTFSFILNGDHDFDVVSLVTAPDNLWSEKTGIYANGPGWTSSYPHFGANFWKDWEREASVSLLTKDGKTEFSLGCVISMFGNWGRGNDKKPFLVKFTEKTGASKLHDQLFADRSFTEYNSFILRAGSQDQTRSKIRDELITSLVGDATDVLVQAYRPVIMYLNGEYWGLYFIREKVNTGMLADHMGVDPESVTIMQRRSILEAGTRKEYDALLDYVASHDPTTDAFYDYVEARVDLVNCIDFRIAQAYSGNSDMHNIRFYRSTQNDGKWRYIFYDIDYGFRLTEGSVERTITMSHNYNEMFNYILRNPRIRQLYLERWNYHLKTTFTQERVERYFNDFVSLVRREMERDNERWGMTEEKWERNLNIVRTFIMGDGKSQGNRLKTVTDELKKVMKMTKEEIDTYITPLFADTAA